MMLFFGVNLARAEEEVKDYWVSLFPGCVRTNDLVVLWVRWGLFWVSFLV